MPRKLPAHEYCWQCKKVRRQADNPRLADPERVAHEFTLLEWRRKMVDDLVSLAEANRRSGREDSLFPERRRARDRGRDPELKRERGEA